MITWLWVIGVPVVLLGIAGPAALTLRLHRQGFTWAGVVAYWRMRRRPAP